MLCTVGNRSLFALFIIYFMQYCYHTNVISVLLLFWSSPLFILIVVNRQSVPFQTFPVLDPFQPPFRILQIQISNTNATHCTCFFPLREVDWSPGYHNSHMLDKSMDRHVFGHARCSNASELEHHSGHFLL